MKFLSWMTVFSAKICPNTKEEEEAATWGQALCLCQCRTEAHFYVLTQGGHPPLPLSNKHPPSPAISVTCGSPPPAAAPRTHTASRSMLRGGRPSEGAAWGPQRGCCWQR